ncbi:hypothetical protein DAETH_39250 (plasmid) [Deinococcus aetherius]|uniref:Uncharacterized protein n=1 Tax=Deinococcus aetherius TaxID=200252 RepID=A0ABM8AJI7_9DEIO|nr:hypothetical protein [Deinococcus aetherius]BDP43956.1 hypothetical protein DAETH_39250 [Deinococcus aetherius]
MTRPLPATLLGGLALALRRFALSLLAAVIVALAAATLLTAAWLVTDPAGALPDAPYAWLGLAALLLAFGAPSAFVFGVVVAPLAALAGRIHPAWTAVTGALGGGLLVLLTTDLRFAVLGVLGGLTYAALEGRLRGRRRG